MTKFKRVMIVLATRPSLARVESRISDNIDGIPCVEWKDVDLLGSWLVVIK